MEDNNSLKRQLTKSISIEIIPVKGEVEINSRVWAINWFNYKSKWLYSLYNRLAAKFVIRMGGQLLFKGHNQKTLLGEESYARHTLLIVTYPSIGKFLDMLLIKAFQLVGLLRVKAVKDFVFGFTRRVDDYNETTTPAIDINNKYLVFHYQGTIEQSSLNSLAKNSGLKTYFSGEKIGQVKRFEKGKKPVVAPFFMDGIVVFETKSKNAIITFVESRGFTELINVNSSNYAAIFTRVK